MVKQHVAEDPAFGVAERVRENAGWARAPRGARAAPHGTARARH